ncbi:MAG: enhanced intracellular survival protein Eis [Micromonosporaceae bacterium]
MSVDIRVLTADDAPAAWALSSLAFGHHHERMPTDWGAAVSGRVHWGLFDDTGRLLAKALDRDQGHWFGGRVVPASGVAGVVVAADVRGGGLSRQLLTRLLAEVRSRGALIATLFNTTPWPYRRLGWEEVGALTRTTVPTMLFDGIAGPAGITTRAATVDDLPAVHAIYAETARASTGMLDRRGPLFTRTPQEQLAEWNGFTVAVGGGEVLGYSTWDRGSGYDASGRIVVGDLMASTEAASTALLAMLGRWASVAPTILFRHGGIDPVHLLTALVVHGRIERRQPWMLRLVDATGAIAARGWSPHLHGAVELELVDPECPWNAGRFRLELESGLARLVPGGTGAVRFTARGLATWYAGAASPDVLRRAGLLDGPADHDSFLLAATAGPPPTLLDYF